MSADGSINTSNESPMLTRPPSPQEPSREEWAQVLRDTYPILTDQEIQRILGLDRSQISLLAQIRGGTLSPRSARTVSQGENLHPVKKGLLEEALEDLQQTRVPMQWVDTK